MVILTLYGAAAFAIGFFSLELALPKMAHFRHYEFQNSRCVPSHVYETVRDQARIAGWHMDPAPNGSNHDVAVTFFPWHARICRLECHACGRRRWIVHGLRWWPARNRVGNRL